MEPEHCGYWNSDAGCFQSLNLQNPKASRLYFSFKSSLKDGALSHQTARAESPLEAVLLCGVGVQELCLALARGRSNQRDGCSGTWVGTGATGDPMLHPTPSHVEVHYVRAMLAQPMRSLPPPRSLPAHSQAAPKAPFKMQRCRGTATKPPH